MATTPTSASNQNLKISSITSSVSSSFLRTVCLHDWWLVKSENDFHGKILSVGGLASRLKQGVRVFSSAPIVKRHDTVTLETADGFTVMVKGLINSSRTRQNGFSHEEGYTLKKPGKKTSLCWKFFAVLTSIPLYSRVSNNHSQIHFWQKDVVRDSFH